MGKDTIKNANRCADFEHGNFDKVSMSGSIGYYSLISSEINLAQPRIFIPPDTSDKLDVAIFLDSPAALLNACSMAFSSFAFAFSGDALICLYFVHI